MLGVIQSGPFDMSRSNIFLNPYTNNTRVVARVYRLPWTAKKAP
eukprot:SAG31_NODE_46603_length_253_cov_1.668831_1_plen_43_part_01